jgi:hypothetical protein
MNIGAIVAALTSCVSTSVQFSVKAEKCEEVVSLFTNHYREVTVDRRMRTAEDELIFSILTKTNTVEIVVLSMGEIKPLVFDPHSVEHGTCLLKGVTFFFYRGSVKVEPQLEGETAEGEVEI